MRLSNILSESILFQVIDLSSSGENAKWHTFHEDVEADTSDESKIDVGAKEVWWNLTAATANKTLLNDYICTSIHYGNIELLETRQAIKLNKGTILYPPYSQAAINDKSHVLWEDICRKIADIMKNMVSDLSRLTITEENAKRSLIKIYKLHIVDLEELF